MKKPPAIRNKDIPRFKLEKFRPVHRSEDVSSSFGNNRLDKSLAIEGFELYSSEGLLRSMGPLKSAFYRISLTVSGTMDMQIGLDNYTHQPGTICFTYPNQIISKNNISQDAFGYYILFTEDFLSELIPSIRISSEFPFYDPNGLPLFSLSASELDTITGHILRINEELRQNNTGKAKAVKMYVYLILLEAKRSYERQEWQGKADLSGNGGLVSRFKTLVSQHYLTQRQVADYAAMLSVTPNHLNRIIKDTTGRTASDTIKEMLLQEASSLLKYTTRSVAEIAYELDFSDPGTFSRFFKKATGQTPLAFRAGQV